MSATKKLTIKGPLAHGRVLEFDWLAGAEVTRWERDNMAVPEVLNLWVSLPGQGEPTAHRFVLLVEGVDVVDLGVEVVGAPAPVIPRDPDASDFGIPRGRLMVARIR